MTIKEIAGRIPYWCKSKNAEREANILKYQIEEEISNPNSVFNKNEKDKKKPFNRLKTAFIFTGKWYKVLHCKNICKLILLLHYKNKHNEFQWDSKIEVLKTKVAIGEVFNQDIKNELPLEKIVENSEW